MRNLKIGKKLLVTFGVIILLLCITVVVAIYGLSAAGDNFKEFYSVGYPVSNKTVEMRRAAQTGLKNMAMAMLTEDQAGTNGYIDEADKEFESLREGFTFMQENFQGDKTVLDEALAILEEGKPYRLQILELAGANRNAEAAMLLFDKYQPIMVEFQAKMTEIDNTTSVMAEEDFQSSFKLQNTVLIVMIVIAVAALAFTVALALYITKSLTAPIKEIEAAANDMVRGKLDVSITYRSKDELGSLSESMRTMTETFKGIIQDMDQGLRAMGDGDFSVDSKAKELYAGEFRQLSVSMHQIIDKLSDTLGQINQSSDQVSAGSEQVSSGAQALSQGATEQASSVEELAATIGEISQQVQETARNAGETRTRTNEAEQQMLDCNRQMEEMIAAMGEISDKSAQIGKIIKTIEDIAFQTNILALNAAVEAARAGAAGKGFAVVADEVRNLASKSAEASKNTAALIEGTVKAVEKGTEVANGTARSLETIVEGNKAVAEAVNRIAVAAEQQAGSITQVTQGIDQISSVVQTNSATAEESAAASEELSSQAQMLKSLVSQFKLRGSASAPKGTTPRGDVPLPREEQPASTPAGAYGGKY